MKIGFRMIKWAPPPPEHYLFCGNLTNLPLYDFQTIGEGTESKAFYCGRAKLGTCTLPQAGDRCRLFGPHGEMQVKIYWVEEQGDWLRVVLCRETG